MNASEFNTVFEQTVEMCRQTLCHKADEYADDNDRLHNFNIAAVLQDETPIKALGGMMVKHTVSVYDLIRRTGKGAEISEAMWDEKITDSINYLILLRAAVAAGATECLLRNADKPSCEKCRTEPQEHTCGNCKYFTEVQVDAYDFYTVCAKKRRGHDDSRPLLQ